MEESAIASFVVWSGITTALMLAAGFAYRAYSGRRRSEIPPS